MTAHADTGPELYGMMAEFENPNDLLRAAHAARAAGYTRMDAFTPYPVEELAEAVGFGKTKLPMLIFAGGLTGCVSGFLMQYYATVMSYPLNIGGRPLNGWPTYIPISFEVTILLSALTAVFAMLALNGFPRPHHPVFNVPAFDRASQDRFFLCVESVDPRFDAGATLAFLGGLAAVQQVHEVPNT